MGIEQLVQLLQSNPELMKQLVEMLIQAGIVTPGPAMQGGPPQGGMPPQGPPPQGGMPPQGGGGMPPQGMMG